MLTYTAAGQGPAVVLLHGFPLNRSIWDQQIRQLSTRFHVIAPDLPGLGASPPLPEDGPPSMAGMASQVLALLDRLGVGSVAVAGHSMGGYVALALQKAVPERVVGLGLISTQAGADTPEAREGRYATAEKVGQEGAGFLATGMAPKLFGPGVAADSAVYSAVASIIREAPAGGVRAALHAMAGREDMRVHLVDIAVPTLVLTGEQDQLIPPERSELMAASIRNAVLVKVPGAGHMPMVEQPQQVTEALAQWLDLVF